MCFRPPTLDSGTIKCPQCGAEIPASSEECPMCGAKEGAARAASGIPVVPDAPGIPKTPGVSDVPIVPKASGVGGAPDVPRVK